MRSVVTGALGIVAGATAPGNPPPDDVDTEVPFEWHAKYLLFAVREPFPSKYTKTDTIFGTIDYNDELVIESEMAEGGAIFADGVVEDAIEFNAGTIVRIGIAERVAKLIRPMTTP